MLSTTFRSVIQFTKKSATKFPSEFPRPSKFPDAFKFPEKSVLTLSEKFPSKFAPTYHGRCARM